MVTTDKQLLQVKYYETHITIEPVFGERLDFLKLLSAAHGFKVADLLMKKRKEDTPERSAFDTFLTSRVQSFELGEFCCNTLIEALTIAGYKVWRKKIEAVILDERF